MVNEIKIVNGKLILEEKKFNRILEKVVIKNNDSSGKITLPKDLIGKKVFVCWEEVKK
jgi:putative transposon-encoded protein